LACTAPEGCVDNKDDCDDNTNLIGYCNTPPSDNPVTVTYENEDGGVKLIFPNVTSGEDTTVTAITGCSLDVPAGYTLNLSNLCYDIQSDASFDGSVEICITFDLGSIPDPPGMNGVVILRCDSTGGNCVPLLDISSLDIDLGEGTGTLCVLTEELSFFTVAIEPDSDFDGWSDSRDNCPNAFNPSQSDEDEDGIGNACDNCPNVWDPSNQCDLCEGDFYEDGDVDGLDVAHLAASPGYLDLALFAVNFGRANCPIPKRQCSGALSYDTGDPGWHWAVNDGYGIAVRFTPLSYPWTLDQAKFWPWSSSGSLDLEVHVWDDDGTGGLPGTDLISPIMHHCNSADQWENIDLPSTTIYEGEFYIGWIQTTSDLYYNGDDDDASYDGRSYVRYPDGTWENFSDLAKEENIMIRQGCQTMP